MNRQDAIQHVSQLALEVRKSETETISKTWDLAYGLRDELLATFDAGRDHYRSFLATAATATKRTEGQVDNMVRATNIRDGLSKAQLSKVASWPYDSILVLAVSDKQAESASKVAGRKMSVSATRTAIISKAKGSSNTKTVRTAKRDVIGATKRTRSTSADATTKLAEQLREKYQQLTNEDGDNYDPMALIAGAQLAIEHGDGTADALLFLATNTTVAASAV